MDDRADEVEELKRLWPGVRIGAEGGYTYYLLPDVALPDGCEPAKTTLLLCPTSRDGYPSRLFFADRVGSRATLNWNGQSRILERNWHAYSYTIREDNLRLAQMVLAHLKALG